LVDRLRDVVVFPWIYLAPPRCKEIEACDSTSLHFAPDENSITAESFQERTMVPGGFDWLQ
jgi:hypothetical protein